MTVGRTRAVGLGLLFGLVSVAATGYAAATETLTKLRPGAPPFERELDGGAVHSYLIVPDVSGELLLTIDQRGIDVTVTLRESQEPPGAREPADPNLFTIDTPNGLWGNEQLVFVASNAASYILEIRSLKSSAAAGRYHVELVSAASEDPLVLDAMRASTEGSRLFLEGTADSRHLALGKYQEASLLWQSAGRSREEGDALFHSAMLYRFLKQPQEALATHRRVLGIRQQEGDLAGQARSWLEIGSAAWSMGESQHSPGAYGKALDLFRRVGDLHGQARALNYLGLVAARKDPRAALPLYQEALDLFRQTADRRQEGVVLNNLGGLQGLLGEPDAALSRYQEALVIQVARGDLAQQAAIWNNMGSTYRRTGRLQEALELFGRSLDARRQLGDRRGEGRVLNNLGLVSLRLGHLERAEASLRQALLARRDVVDRRGEAVTLLNLGFLHAERGQWSEALDSYGKALKLQRITSDRSSEATTLIEVGRAHAELGRSEAAQQHLREALVILEDLANPWRKGLAKAALGQVLTDFGKPVQAVVVLEESLELLRPAGDDRGTLAALLALARAERQVATLEPSPDAGKRAQRLQSAWDHTSEALDLLETLRIGVDSLDSRSTFLSRHGDAFSQATDLAMHLHDVEPGVGWSAKGLEISERSKARSLLDQLEESTAGHRSEIDGALTMRQRALLDRLNAKVERRRSHLKRGNRQDEVERLGQEILQITQSLDDLESRIRRQSPQWAAMTHPRPLRADAIQALLEADTMLLEYSLGTPHSYLWAVTRDTMQSYRLADRSTIEGAARDAYEAFRVYQPGTSTAAATSAQRLSDLLLTPLMGRLENQRLVIVADGGTHYIPFGALPHPASADAPVPMLVHHEMLFLPSASVLGMQRAFQGGPSKAGKTLAILADPVFETSDPRALAAVSAGQAFDAPSRSEDVLPQDTRLRDGTLQRLAWSRWEAEAIAAHAEDTEVALALGFEANLRAVKEGFLEDHRILHFATHGVIDSQHPELSALVLSAVDAQGQPQPSLLRLPEIYNLRLDADLVVLSGCETALGSDVRGEGLVGLSRGFFAAGARRLVASLWRVQDRATAELMDRFYRRLLSDPGGRGRPASALREAQLELLHSVDYHDPYHWAGFALYGDWR